MRIVQVVDALDYGDGVSNHIINLSKLLTDNNIKNVIYSKWYHDRVQNLRFDLNKFTAEKDDIIMYHFSGKSFITEKIIRSKCKKVLCYHNVTPPAFFEKYHEGSYENCMEGIQQLKHNLSHFNFFCADSEFNKLDLIQYGVKPERIWVLPIVLNLEGLKEVPVNKALACSLQQERILLFVGRIAPNKKIETILEIFESYHNLVDNRTKLLLVGNLRQNENYVLDLMQILGKYNSRDNVEFTGKVSNEDLHAYYRNANVFICMSEHEGFCIPLIEAMYYDIPVVAYNSSAVPYTLGKSGVLVYDRDSVNIAKLLGEIFDDSILRQKIIEQQRINISRFSNETIFNLVKSAMEIWGD